MAGAPEDRRTALNYELAVNAAGRVDVSVPLPAAVWVSVFVVPEPGEAASALITASESSLDFCDNPLDDEDRNDA